MTAVNGAEPDDAVYRTELTQRGDGSWQLRIDGVLVADTDRDDHDGDEGGQGRPVTLDQDAAKAWARRQMGEGVQFLNGLYRDPSTYWVATADTERRAMAAYYRHHPDEHSRAAAL